MAFAPYVSADELKSWVQVPGDAKRPVIEEVCEATTRAIDEWCQRHFWQDGTSGAPVARTFQACSPGRLDLGEFNDLTDVAAPAVATDPAGDGTFEAVWAASDFQLFPFNRPTGRPYTAILATAGRVFPGHSGTGRRDRVRVTGVWGWPSVPAPVKQAAKIKAARIFTRMQSPNGIAGLDNFGPVRISRSEDPDVASLLEPYRRTVLLVA